MWGVPTRLLYPGARTGAKRAAPGRSRSILHHRQTGRYGDPVIKVADPRGEGSEPDSSGRALTILAVLALIAGVVTGLIGGAFRWTLLRAQDLRESLLDWAHDLGAVGVIVMMLAVAVCAAVAALIVRFVPRTGGSGIQIIEAVQRDQAEAPRLRVLPAKFFGSLLALGSGLVLGREGPTVHMGAVIGAEAGRISRRSSADITTLQTSLAGAGLAVAFNAPIGGALFVFEEVTRSFHLRTVVPVTIGVSSAVWTSWALVGTRTDFSTVQLDPPRLDVLPLFLFFGVLTGLIGAVYNRAVMTSLTTVDRFSRMPREATAAIIGLLIGCALFIDPNLAGDGDSIVQSLLSGTAYAIPIMLLWVVVRFGLGPLSYAAGTPGGLFAPILAVGALWGAIFAAVVSWFIPSDPLTIPFAIVGMATFFAATVRAPFTGAVIVLEMTGATVLAVPLIIAAGCAVLTASLVRSEPIYDSLRARMLGDSRPADAR